MMWRFQAKQINLIILPSLYKTPSYFLFLFNGTREIIDRMGMMIEDFLLGLVVNRNETKLGHDTYIIQLSCI